MTRRPFESWATLAVFGAALGSVLFDQVVFDIDPSEPVSENRYLATMPSILDASSLQSFRRDFERYHRDNLGLRDSLIRTHSLLEARVLAKTVLRAGDMTVYVGSRKWLYYGYSMRDYLGKASIRKEQLDWWVDSLRRRTDLLANQGVRYLFVVAPVKAGIYPEHLPSRARRRTGPLALDELITRVDAEHPGIGVLDLRPVLQNAKDWRELYWRTDHHWNAAGGCVAAIGIAAYLRRWSSRTPLLSLRSFDCKSTPATERMSLAQGLGLPGYHAEVAHSISHPTWSADAVAHSRDEATGDLVSVNRARSDGLRVVCIGDSFTFALLPFYSQLFARVRFVGRWGASYDEAKLAALVESENADLVLEERVEWGLLEAPAK